MICITDDWTCWLRVHATIKGREFEFNFMSAPYLLYAEKDFLYKILVNLLAHCDDVQNPWLSMFAYGKGHNWRWLVLTFDFLSFPYLFNLIYGWMDGLVFYIFFNSIQSVVIGLRKADYERLSAMKCCLGLQRIPSPVWFKPRNMWSKDGSANR